GENPSPEPASGMPPSKRDRDEVNRTGGRESQPPIPSIPSGAPDAVELLLEEVTEEPEASPLAAGRSLRGRCMIVTGGATGIGRAVALEFARHGTHVAFNYFDHEGDGSVAAEAATTAREITQLEVRV